MATTRYEYEIYEGSWVNDASIWFQTDKPMLNFNKGDLINTQTFDRWHENYSIDDKLEIVEVEHIIIGIDNPVILHKVMLLVRPTYRLP